MIDKQPRFAVGDLVWVRVVGSHRTLWRIVGDDTNCTPVRDPEPAYHLKPVNPRRDGRSRYAYESELMRAEVNPYWSGVPTEQVNGHSSEVQPISATAVHQLVGEETGN